VPTATTVVGEAPASRKAPVIPAAADPREAPAEISNVVGCAEAVSPTRGRRLQGCGVHGLLPTLDLWLGILGLGLIGHLQVGTFVALALGHLVVAISVPTATTVVGEAPASRKAPVIPAAADPREAPAEISNVVGCAEAVSPARGRRLQRCGVHGLLPTLDLWSGILRLGLIRHFQVGTFVALALGHLVVSIPVPSKSAPAATTVVDEAATSHEAPVISAAAHSCEALAPIPNVMGCAETISPIRGRRLQRCGIQGFLPALDLWLGVVRLGLIRHLQVGTSVASLGRFRCRSILHTPSQLAFCQNLCCQQRKTCCTQNRHGSGSAALQFN